MNHFLVRNVSEALFRAQEAIRIEGRDVQTRNGKAYEFKGPVVTTYTHPRERVLFYKERDANPFFHFMESMWMLAGHNDVDWILQFNGRMNNYSDDGVTFHGAYGYRWRTWFNKDQLEIAQHRLLTYQNDRRTVVTMWDPTTDLNKTNDGKDYPCNTQIFFELRDETLAMTVVNRSNDMIWGAYGANAVHMSFLQEYMAQMIGVAVGRYTQFSNNLHAYAEPLQKLEGMHPQYHPYEALDTSEAPPYTAYESPKLVTHPDCFDQELEHFMQGEWEDPTDHEYKNEYLRYTAVPMFMSWRLWKEGDKETAILLSMTIQDLAWQKACTEWFMRRM